MKTKTWLTLGEASAFWMTAYAVVSGAHVKVIVPCKGGPTFTTNIHFYVATVGETKTLLVKPADCCQFKSITNSTSPRIAIVQSTTQCEANYSLTLVDTNKEADIQITGETEPGSACANCGGGGSGTPPTQAFDIDVLQKMADIYYAVPSNGTNLNTCCGTTNTLTTVVTLGDGVPASGIVHWSPSPSSLGTITANDVALSSGGASTTFIAANTPGSGTITATGQNLMDAGGISVPVTPSTDLAVKDVKLAVNSLEFSGTTLHEVLQDDGSGAYPSPQWTPSHSFPVCYTRNTKPTITGTFSVTPSLSGMIKIKGNGPGNISFPATDVSVSGGTATLGPLQSSGAFPNQVDFLDPMIMHWQFSLDGGNTYCDAGRSTNQVYVTLNDPAANAQLFHTVLKLACSTTGALTADQAVTDAWLQLTPLNFTTWDGIPLYYYKPGTTFAENAQHVDSILNSANGGGAGNGGGQCTAWTELFHHALLANGVQSLLINVTLDPQLTFADDTSEFLIKDWGYSQTNPHTETFPFLYRLTRSIPASATPADMFPVPTGGVYGGLASGATLPGQNSGAISPSQKMFKVHSLLKYPPSSSGQYHDPSYGIIYVNPADFATRAISGYARKYDDDQINPAVQIWQVKQNTEQLIRFSQ